MITINELRVGNWLFADGIPAEVTHIKPNLIVLQNGSKDTKAFRPQYIQPIPISREELIAFGFEEDDGEFQHPDNTDFDLMFSCSENGLWCAYNFAKDSNGLNIPKATIALPLCNPFKYIHQLQNIYFALTGKEL